MGKNPKKLDIFFTVVTLIRKNLFDVIKKNIRKRKISKNLIMVDFEFDVGTVWCFGARSTLKFGPISCTKKEIKLLK